MATAPLLPSYQALFAPIAQQASGATALGWSGQSDTAVLRGHSLLPLGLGEWATIASHLPIVLVPTGTTGEPPAWCAAAALGLSEDQNLCLGPKGGWIPPVQPRAAQLLPFGLTGDPLQVGAATASSAIGQGAGFMALVDGEGRPSPAVAERLQLAQQWAAQLAAAAAAVARLDGLGLLEPFPSPAGLRLNPELAEAKVLSRSALRQLDDTQLLALHHEGLLEAAHALLFSTQQLQRLLRMLQVRRNQPQPAAAASGHAGGPRQPRDPISGQPLA